MDLADLGSIGEFLGAIAVVASLWYLAVQIRQNTRSSRSATFQAVAAAANQFNFTVGQDPQVARVFRLGLVDSADLTDDERIQFTFLITAFFRNFENMFQHQDEVGWTQRRDNVAAILRFPGAKRWWEEHRHGFAEEFRSEVERVRG